MRHIQILLTKKLNFVCRLTWPYLTSNVLRWPKLTSRIRNNPLYFISYPMTRNDLKVSQMTRNDLKMTHHDLKVILNDFLATPSELTWNDHMMIPNNLLVTLSDAITCYSYRNDLNVTQHDLIVTRNDLEETRIDLKMPQNGLIVTRNDLKTTLKWPKNNIIISRISIGSRKIPKMLWIFWLINCEKLIIMIWIKFWTISLHWFKN